MSNSVDKLADPWWRLNNLYWIKDKAGNRVKFKPNWAQRILYERMWFLNIILKARQLGMTTFIQLFMLDRALFNDNTNCGIVAHNKEDAEAFFRDKIKFAYDNLPADLRTQLHATSDTTRSYTFSNGSTIRVGTSLRSGTYQYVHISEFGKLCAKYPDKAREVITGTLNTVAPGQFVFIESTAEGPFGHFYKMCQTAQFLQEGVKSKTATLTKMDYKFVFFPWHEHPDYVLHEAVEIPPKLSAYFKMLREEHDIELTDEQKFWYVKKKEEQQDDMKQEYPSIWTEAFERSDVKAIYGEQLGKARRDGRICELPIVRGVPVNTFWDLGRNDVMAIWFMQDVDNWYHFIYYTEGRLQDLTHYAGVLQDVKRQLDIVYGTHYLPHDASVIELSSQHNQTREQILNEAGVNPTVVVPKIANLNTGIEITRKKFAQCRFDQEGCEEGLRALLGYEWAWDEAHQTTRKSPIHNWASNGADAFRQFAQGYRGRRLGFAAQAQQYGDGRNGRAYARQRSERGTIFNPDTRHVV
jgi:hypothetical protein